MNDTMVEGTATAKGESKDALHRLNKFVRSPKARDLYGIPMKVKQGVKTSGVEFDYAGHIRVPPLEPHVHQMQLNDAEVEELFGEPPILRRACLHQEQLWGAVHRSSHT